MKTNLLVQWAVCYWKTNMLAGKHFYIYITKNKKINNVINGLIFFSKSSCYTKLNISFLSFIIAQHTLGSFLSFIFSILSHYFLRRIQHFNHVLRIHNQLQIPVISFFFRIQGYISLLQHYQGKFNINEVDCMTNVSCTSIQISTSHSSTRLFFPKQTPFKYVYSCFIFFAFFIGENATFTPYARLCINSFRRMVMLSWEWRHH